MTVLEILFWLCVLLLVYAQVGYGALLALLGRLRPSPAAAPPPDPAALPSVSLIVAAYREAEVIGAKVANALALDYPRERLEIVVACDGSPDATPALARAAGADLVLELPRGGKIRAQDAAVAQAAGELVAFSDANALLEPGALRALVAPFADDGVGYVCGQVRFVNEPAGADATNQEGLYWRYEMWLRAMESRLSSVTGATGPSTPPARLVSRRRRGDGPRPQLPLQHGQAGMARRLRAAGPGHREDGPLHRG